MSINKFTRFAMVATLGLFISSAHAQAPKLTGITPITPSPITPVEGTLTKAQMMALRVSNFTLGATPQAGGGYKMTGVCDGGHKIKIAGRKNGTSGSNTMGVPAIMFEFEMICNQADPSHPPIYAPVAGKVNVYSYDTNIRLSSTPTAASPGVSAGAWTVNATQKGGSTAPVQDVILPPMTITF